MSLTRESYNAESRIMAVTGFIAGLMVSAFFGWSTIVLLNKLSEMNDAIMR